MKRLPTQVKLVRDELRASAARAGLPVGLVHSSQETKWEDGIEKFLSCWVIGSDFEDGSPSIVAEGKSPHVWASRDPLTGEDRKMSGGFAEAIANASIFFTG